MNSSDRFSEEQVRALIARAIELDAREQSSTAEDVRAIATELGISARAVESALQELHTVTPAAPTRDSSPAVIAGTIVLGIGAGALMGLAMPGFVVGSLGLIAIGFLGSGALLVVQGRKPTIRLFLRRNFTLWAGLAAGTVVTAGIFSPFPALTGVVVSWCIRGLIASSILGSAAVIAVRRAVTPGDSGGMSSAGNDSGSFGDRLLAPVRRIADWLTRIFRRETITILRHVPPLQVPRPG